MTEILAKRPTSPTVTADSVRSMPQVNPERIVRIDSGHTDESTPPSRPAVWGALQGGLIPRLLERNSLLATAAIIVVVALVVVRLNHRNGRSEPAGLRNTSSASPTIVDQKTDSPRQITKISPMERGANMHPPAERSASERGRGSAKIPAVPTASQSPELPNPGHLKGIRTPAENESPSGPSGWNLPAAANAPAAIEAQAPQTNSRLSSPTATDGASFNLARRDDPVPTRGIAPRQTPGDNGAVMLGIEKAPFEVPR